MNELAKKIKSKDTQGKLVLLLLVAMYFFHYLLTSADWHIMDNVNLVIHEAGHTLMMPFIFGQFIYVLGGSLFQILIPSVFIGYFAFRKDFFSSFILLFWLGQNFINVSIYAGDSIVMQLPLLGGDSSTHDWHYLLTHAHLLQYTYLISHVMSTVGTTLIFLAAIGALVSIFRADTSNREEEGVILDNSI